MEWLKMGILFVVILLSVEAAPDSLKLPNSSIPISYSLTLSFSVLGTRSIDGNVIIDLEITEDTETIVLHSRNLNIRSVKLTAVSGGEVLDTTFGLQPENDFLIVNVTRTLLKSEKLSIEIVYTSVLQLSPKGIYRTSYKFNNLTTRYLVATQFGNKEARSAFVCYDEIEYKATFTLKLKHELDFFALSVTDGNRIAEGESLVNSWFTRSTPKMSVDNFGFVVSDFVFNAFPDSVNHRFYSRNEDLESTRYAMGNAANFLRELESYIAHKYEFTRLYHFAIPELELDSINTWGLIAYNDKNVVGDENSAHFDVLKLLQVVANAVTHQFFGDLVTHKSEDFQWLTEGFATFFEEILLDFVHHDIRSRDFFNLQRLQSAFQVDAMESKTHPLSFQGDDLLREIVHHKSGSIIRMFANVVGEAIFHKALEFYLNDNHHNSVTPASLYKAFENVTSSEEYPPLGFSFADAFKTWELQKGFPVIHVGLSMGKFVVTQERFFTEQKKTSDDTSSWFIPLNYAIARNPVFDDTTITNIFLETTENLTIIPPKTFDTSQWFIFNKQQLGFYRVNYDPENWKNLIEGLNSSDYNQIHVLNRAQLVDDSISLAAGDYLDYETTFGILSYLAQEVEYTPWKPAELFINQLYKTFGTSQKNLNMFVHALTINLYESFNIAESDFIPEEGVYERHGRELAWRLACGAGNTDCIYDSTSLSYFFLFEDRALPKGLESIILCNGLKGFSKETYWNQMWNKMRTSEDSVFRSQAIKALACIENLSVLKFYLETIIRSPMEVNNTPNERKEILKALLSNQIIFGSVIEFLKETILDVVMRLEYEELSAEPILFLVAQLAQTEENHAIFIDYLAYYRTLTPIDDVVYQELLDTADAFFTIQTEPKNAKIMETILKLTESETTTIIPTVTTTSIPTTTLTETTTATPTTTLTETKTSTATTTLSDPTTVTTSIEPTNPPTVPPTNPPTLPPTNPPTLPPTTPPTNPPTLPPTTPPTPPPTTPPTLPPTTPQAATEPTTLGASSVGVKITTLLACVFVAFLLKTL